MACTSIRVLAMSRLGMHLARIGWVPLQKRGRSPRFLQGPIHLYRTFDLQQRANKLTLEIESDKCWSNLMKYEKEETRR